MRWIGDVSVTRVEEMCGPGFQPGFLYPDWDPAIVAELQDWLVPQCYLPEQDRLIASIHTWVVRTGRHTILVDSCTGNGKNRPAFPRFHMLETPFLQRLADAGVAPEAVDFVLCTHLHVDHCGWNTRLENGRWVPTFPNARYVFSRAELAEVSANTSGFNAFVYEDSVLPVVEAGQHMVVDGEDQLGDGLRIEPAPGHTKGHVVLHLESRGQRAVFSGDVMHQPIQVYRPEWSTCFCTDRAEAARSRRRVLECVAESGATLFPGHFAGTHAGTVTSRGGGFDWHFLEAE